MRLIPSVGNEPSGSFKADEQRSLDHFSSKGCRKDKMFSVRSKIGKRQAMNTREIV